MQGVKIDKSRLLEKLIENRAEHRARYIEVEIAYRKKVVEECYETIKNAENAEKFNRCLRAIEPQDHTGDYDKAILMLEYSTEDTVQLAAYEFDNYILDEWDWSNAFGDTYMSYTDKA